MHALFLMALLLVPSHRNQAGRHLSGRARCPASFMHSNNSRAPQQPSLVEAPDCIGRLLAASMCCRTTPNNAEAHSPGLAAGEEAQAEGGGSC